VAPGERSSILNGFPGSHSPHPAALSLLTVCRIRRKSYVYVIRKKEVTMKVIGIFATMLSVVFAAPLFAQDSMRPWGGHFGGGWSVPLNETSDKVKDGWHLMGGVLLHANERMAVRMDLEYDTFDATRQTLQSLHVPDAYADIWSGTGGLQWTLNPGGRARLYVFGGAGAYYKRAVATKPTLAPAVVCDPWWDFCFDVLVPADTVLGKKSETSFGANAGGGLEFGMPRRTSFFVEAKYQWVNGHRAIEYIPVTIGFRW
jgi:opacity protein-like surface antigen